MLDVVLPGFPLGAIGRATEAVTSLFGGLYDGPTPTGLAAYEVVKKGEVGKGQLSAKDYEELERRGFGDLDVVPDGTRQELGHHQMTQSQFEELAQAWLTLSRGDGAIDFQGKAKDIEGLKKMMAQGIGDSPVFRDLITSLGHKGPDGAQFQVNAGRSQSGVLFDDYDNLAIDLDDLEALPVGVDPDHPDGLTRPEILLHILSERQAGMNDGFGYDLGHGQAVRDQTKYRAERGQTPIKEQRLTEEGIKVVLADGRELDYKAKKGGRIQPLGK